MVDYEAVRLRSEEFAISKLKNSDNGRIEMIAATWVKVTEI